MQDYEEGYCPMPRVYPVRDDPILIYDAEGNPLMIKKVKLGFDLNPE